MKKFTVNICEIIRDLHTKTVLRKYWIISVTGTRFGGGDKVEPTGSGGRRDVTSEAHQDHAQEGRSQAGTHDSNCFIEILISICLTVNTVCVQDVSSALRPGFSWLVFGVFHCLPNSALADLAEAIGQLGNIEHESIHTPNPTLRADKTPCSSENQMKQFWYRFRTTSIPRRLRKRMRSQTQHSSSRRSNLRRRMVTRPTVARPRPTGPPWSTPRRTMRRTRPWPWTRTWSSQRRPPRRNPQR